MISMEPQVIRVSGTMVMIPHEFVVTGHRGDSQTIHNGHWNVVRDHFPCATHTRDQAHRAFVERYYAAGVRGATVEVLYRLDRMH